MNFYFNPKLSIILFMLLGSALFSQEKGVTKLFDVEIKKIANQYKSNTYFYDATSFFIEKEWDSTLLASMKHLNTSESNLALANYAHYFRGDSFFFKGIFKEAEKEFDLISHDFYFYDKVKKRLGELALEGSKFEKSVLIFEELIKLPEDKLPFSERSNIFYNLALSYLHLNQFKEAEPYLIKSLKLKEQQKDTIEMITSYVSVAALYYEQYKDDIAIPYYKKAYDLSKKIDDLDSKELATINMAVIEENRKDFKKALIYRKEYEKWKDSLNDQNKIWEVAQLEKQFAVREKQKEVVLLRAENKAKISERNGLLYSVLTLLILLGTAIYFYHEKNKSNKIIVTQKEGLDELNATKDKLFSIVSHDLRSSVHALKTSNAKLLDNLEAKNLDALDEQLHSNSAIVNGAYNLLDNLLHWALLQTKQTYFEITSIKLFFIVEQTAYNYKPIMLEDNIDFKNDVKKADQVFVDQESLKIILRNLLDNAIKFTEADGTIKIYTKASDENYLELVVEDSGIGMAEATRLELLKDSVLLSKKENENSIGTGLGLQLCKSMIEKNKGKFAIESELGKGTKMIVSLPKTASNG